MKTLSTKTIAALAITGALSIGSASAMGLNAGTKPLDTIVGISSPSVYVKIDDGVATLFGNVESSFDSNLAENHVENIEGVDRVINLVTYN